MRSLITKSRIIVATITAIVLAIAFITGARHGYQLGYVDGENRANGWWIDKKSRYYESGEVRKKRINLKYNQV